MKAILKIVALFSALLLAVEARAEGDDVFVPVAKYISRGDAESLTAWFADNLEISILSSSTDSSRSQASRILKNFFNSYSFTAFVCDNPYGYPGEFEICPRKIECRR